MTFPNDSSIPNYRHNPLTGTNLFETSGHVNSSGTFQEQEFTITNGAQFESSNSVLLLPNLGAHCKQEAFTPTESGAWYQLRFDIRSNIWPHACLGVQANPQLLNGSAGANMYVARVAAEQLNRWEEVTLYFYSSAQHKGLRFNFFQFEEVKIGAGNGEANLRVRNIQLRKAYNTREFSGAEAPRQRRAFGSNKIRISRRGDFYVKDGGGVFQETQIRGLYEAPSRASYQIYADNGFNTVFQVKTVASAQKCEAAGLYYFWDVSNWVNPNRAEYSTGEVGFVAGTPAIGNSYWADHCVGWYIDYENDIAKEYSRVLEVIGFMRNHDADLPIMMVSTTPHLAQRFNNDIDAVACYMNSAVETHNGNYVSGQEGWGRSVVPMAYLDLPLLTAIYNQPHEENAFRDDVMNAFAHGWKHYAYWKDGLGATNADDITTLPWWSGINANNAYFEQLKPIIGQSHQDAWLQTHNDDKSGSNSYGAFTYNNERYLLKANNQNFTSGDANTITIDQTMTDVRLHPANTSVATPNSPTWDPTGSQQEAGIYRLVAGTAVDQPPVVVNSTLPSGTTGQAYSVANVVPGYVQDPEGQTVTFPGGGVSTPSGLSLSSTGAVSGTPSAAGTYTIPFTAEDPGGNQTNGTFTVTVTDSGGTQQPNCQNAADGALTSGMNDWVVSGTNADWLEATGPSSSNNLPASGYADFTFTGLTSGQTYYVHVMGQATDGLSDTLHTTAAPGYSPSSILTFAATTTGGSTEEWGQALDNDRTSFVATGTTHVVRVLMREPGFIFKRVCVSTSATDPNAGGGGNGGGASNCVTGAGYDNHTPASLGEWDIFGDYVEANLTGFADDPANNSPRVDYGFSGLTPNSTQWVWLEIEEEPNNADADSIHVGSDGNPNTAVVFHYNNAAEGTKRFQRVDNSVTASGSGTYTVSLWGREDGARIHRVCLSTSATDPTPGTVDPGDPFSAVDITVSPPVTVGGPAVNIDLLTAIQSGTGFASCEIAHGDLVSTGGTDATLTPRGVHVMLVGSNQVSTNQERGTNMVSRIQGVIAKKNAGMPIQGVIIRDSVKQFVEDNVGLTSPTALPTVNRDFTRIIRDQIIPMCDAAGLTVSVYPYLRKFGASSINNFNPFPTYFRNAGWDAFGVSSQSGNITPDMTNLDSAIAIGSIYKALDQYLSNNGTQSGMSIVYSGETAVPSDVYGSNETNRVNWYKQWMVSAKEALPNGLPTVEINYMGSANSIRALGDEMKRVGGVAWGQPDTHRCWFPRLGVSCPSGYGIKTTRLPVDAYNIYYDEYRGDVPFNPNNELRDMVAADDINGVKDGLNFAFDIMDATHAQVLWDGPSSGKSGSNGDNIDLGKYSTFRDAAINDEGDGYYTGNIANYDYNLGTGGGGSSTYEPQPPFEDATAVRTGNNVLYTPSTDPNAEGQTDEFTFCLQDNATGTEVQHQVFIPYAGTAVDLPVPPVCPAATGTVGQPYTSSVVPANQLSGVTYSLVSFLPDGLSLNPTTGVISGTPTTTWSGQVVIKATNANGMVQTTCVIDIGTPANDPPNAPPCPDSSATVGQAYDSSVATTDPDGDTLIYSVNSGVLPGGLNLNQTTGQLSGTPVSSGVFNFIVRATDPGGLFAETSCQIAVDSQGGLVPPSLSGIYAPATVNSAYSSSLLVTDPNGGATVSLVGGALPPGLSLTNDSTVFGTPQQTGTYGFILKVEDSLGLSSVYDATVVVSQTVTRPTISGAFAAGVVGQNYASTPIVISPGGTPTVTLESGALPPGLSLSRDGTVSGIPEQRGTYNFALRVTDPQGEFSVGSFTININEGQGSDFGVCVNTQGGCYLACTEISLTANLSDIDPNRDYSYQWMAQQNNMQSGGVIFSPQNGKTTMASNPNGGQYDILCIVSDGTKQIVSSPVCVIFQGSGTTGSGVSGADLTIG